MNNLMYFFPGKHGVTDALLRECALSQIVEDTVAETREVIGGPGGQAGVCVVFRRADSESVRVAYDGAAQHWEECAGGAYWIGYWRDVVPGPQDLARDVQVAGHLVELADGREWIIPLVRQFDGGTAVPQVIKFRADGSVEHDINPKYSEFYSRGMQVWESVAQDNKWGPSEEWILDTAIEALTVNYHVGKWEVSALGLLDTRNTTLVVQAIVDGPTYKRWTDLKKNAELPLDSFSLSDGSMDSSQDTDPPAQT